MTELDFDSELNQKKAKKRTYTSKVHKALVLEAKRKGWEQIIYKTLQGRRLGWVVADTGKVYTLRLVGDMANVLVPQKERTFVLRLGTWQRMHREVRKAMDKQRKEHEAHESG